MIGLSLNFSVGGRSGVNKQRDVKIVQALLNVYLRRENKVILRITGKMDDKTSDAIFKVQKEVLKMIKPDGRIDPAGRTINTLIKILKGTRTFSAVSAPEYGRVTWDSEGTEGGIFHSRTLHVPTNASGLTLGRGYDFRFKQQSTVISDLTAAGVAAKYIEILKKSSGLFGVSARQFIIDNDLLDFEITPGVQKKLFKISYAYEEKQVKRICKKKDVVKIYGECDWDKLHKAIKDIVIDLKFRGDYTSKTRKFLQATIVKNDLGEFKKLVSDKSRWKNVPSERFKRRKRFVEEAALEVKKV